MLALRSYTVRGMTANTTSLYRNKMFCPLKCDSTDQQDEQEHLLKCHRLMAELKDEQSDIAPLWEHT